MSTVAILYVSRTGTTREIAERLEILLDAAGHRVALYDIVDDRSRIVEDLGTWDRVILGSPIHGMRPSREIKAVVDETPELRGRVAGVFFTSMVHPTGRRIWRRAIEKGAAGLATAVGTDRWVIFGGRADGELPGFVRRLFGTDRDLPRDQRDWAAIDAWSSDVPV